MIKATCQCGARYQVEERLAGKTASCRKCGAKFRIPLVPLEIAPAEKSAPASRGRVVASTQSGPPDLPAAEHCDSCGVSLHDQTVFSEDAQKLCKGCYLSQPREAGSSHLLLWGGVGVAGVLLAGLVGFFIGSGKASSPADGADEKKQQSITADGPETASSGQQVSTLGPGIRRDQKRFREVIASHSGRPLKWQTNFHVFRSDLAHFQNLYGEILSPPGGYASSGPDSGREERVRNATWDLKDKLSAEFPSEAFIWEDLFYLGYTVEENHMVLKFDMRIHGINEAMKDANEFPFRLLFRPSEHTFLAWKQTTPNRLVSLSGYLSGFTLERQPTGHPAVVNLNSVALMDDGYRLMGTAQQVEFPDDRAVAQNTPPIALPDSSEDGASPSDATIPAATTPPVDRRTLLARLETPETGWKSVSSARTNLYGAVSGGGQIRILPTRQGPFAPTILSVLTGPALKLYCLADNPEELPEMELCYEFLAVNSLGQTIASGSRAMTSVRFQNGIGQVTLDLSTLKDASGTASITIFFREFQKDSSSLSNILVVQYELD